MATRRSWHWISHEFSSGSPGLAQGWNTYIARSRDGKFHVRWQGDEDQEEEIGDESDLINFIADSPSPTITAVRDQLAGIRGFKHLCEMIDARMLAQATGSRFGIRSDHRREAKKKDSLR